MNRKIIFVFGLMLSTFALSDIKYGPDNNQIKRMNSISGHQYKKSLAGALGYNQTTFENDVLAAKSRI